MKFFDWVVEIIGWFKIAISPTLIGVILGLIVYGTLQNIGGIILGALLALIGFLTGIIWATKIFRSKKGTMHYVSRIYATPELDDDPENE